MSDAMERNCGSCARGRVLAGRNIACEKCVNYSLHKFPEEVEPGPIAFVDKIKEALPKPSMTGTVNPVYIERHTESTKEKFSLDKLIDDHWNYIGGLLDAHRGDTVVDLVQSNYSNYKGMIEFHYKSAFRHGYKHALERHNIRESDDE